MNLGGSKMAVRRTDLYLPANSEKFILKAPTLGADVITLDMEDAVPPAEKATARKMVRQHIKAMSVHGSEAWVRINAWDTGLTMDDLNAVVIDGLDGITLPKCSGADDVKRLDFIVTDLEEKRGLPVGKIKLAILIETAIGVMNVDEAVFASDRLVAVIFGAVDYTRDMRVTRTDTAEEQIYARAKIGVAARAAGLVAEDAPFPSYKDDEAFEKEVKRCLNLEETCIKAGKTVCCYTTRALITADTGDKEDELRLSVKISDAVQSLVGRLSVTPSFVIAKGGITSSDVGTKALAVKKANVLGQIKPGIPVWQTGEESKFPLTPYVIFPGNVGEVTTLREAVEVLTAK